MIARVIEELKALAGKVQAVVARWALKHLRPRYEPIAAAWFVTGAGYLVGWLGLDVDPATLTPIAAAVATVLFAWARHKVTPMAKLEDATEDIIRTKHGRVVGVEVKGDVAREISKEIAKGKKR